MNRRGFLKFLGAATVGSYVAYSFPSIIIPKNIISVEPIVTASQFNLTALNELVREEIYPRVIRDNFFNNTPFLAYLKEKHEEGIVAHSLGEAVHLINKADSEREVKVYSQIESYYRELQEEIDKRLI